MSAEYGMASLEVRLRALMQTVGRTPNSADALADGLETELFAAAAAAAAALREAVHIEMV